MSAALMRLPDRWCDGGRLQTIWRGFQAIVTGLAGASFGEGENFMRRGRHQPRGRPPGVACLDELARCPNQNVGIPDRRYAMFGHGFDRDPRRTHMKIDRRHTPRLGEAEK